MKLVGRFQEAVWEGRNDGIESVRAARWRIRHRSCG
jgi:hypothetical protein